MKFKILLLALSAITVVVFGSEVHAQTTFRGELNEQSAIDLAETNLSLKLESIVAEIEEAGFNLDVEEGFEEEWEEEFWVSANDEEIEALLFDPDDTTFPAEDELLSEEIEDDWTGEGDSWEEISYEDEEFSAFIDEDDFLNDSSEEIEIDELLLDVDSDIALFEENEEAFDPGWEAILEAWELEEIDFEMEDDIDLMEDIFNSAY